MAARGDSAMVSNSATYKPDFKFRSTRERRFRLGEAVGPVQWWLVKVWEGVRKQKAE